MIFWFGLIMLVTAKAAEQELATIESINSICGQENSDFDTNKFPWTTAILEKNKNYLKFICGGNLISTRTVVTLAHCFLYARPENFMVSMGGNNSAEWKDALNTDIEKIIQHPDYKNYQPNYDADIAVVQLKQAIIFSTSVKPICMWSGSNDESEIADKPGVIAAWNTDWITDLTKTSIPSIINATVVSESTCLRSNPHIIQLTSKRTLCVDVLDEKSKCFVKSGNGLMIKKENKWMLRAMAAGGLTKENTRDGECTIIIEGYFIFSDTAKYSEWIRSNMLL